MCRLKWEERLYCAHYEIGTLKYDEVRNLGVRGYYIRLYMRVVGAPERGWADFPRRPEARAAAAAAAWARAA